MNLPVSLACMADLRRERALSFLYRLRGWVVSFAERQGAEPWPERDGRVAGAIDAFELAGLLDADEVEAWRAELSEPAFERPVASPTVQAKAAELLEELLAAVPHNDDECSPELERFEGAIAALTHIGVASAEWDQRLREWLGRPTAEKEEALVRALNAGGTEQELVAVLAGPEVAIDGMRVVHGLRFSDGVSFTLRREDARDDRGDFAFWDLELRDDLGTEYHAGGSSGSELEEHMSFRTAVPAEASWLELASADGSAVRIEL